MAKAGCSILAPEGFFSHISFPLSSLDHNNVRGDTPFHGHSSEAELHKPFTTRSP